MNNNYHVEINGIIYDVDKRLKVKVNRAIYNLKKLEKRLNK